MKLYQTSIDKTIRRMIEVYYYLSLISKRIKHTVVDEEGRILDEIHY